MEDLTTQNMADVYTKYLYYPFTIKNCELLKL